MHLILRSSDKLSTAPLIEHKGEIKQTHNRWTYRNPMPIQILGKLFKGFEVLR